MRSASGRRQNAPSASDMLVSVMAAF
jgi:hypothetical protein